MTSASSRFLRRAFTGRAWLHLHREGRRHMLREDQVVGKLALEVRHDVKPGLAPVGRLAFAVFGVGEVESGVLVRIGGHPFVVCENSNVFSKVPSVVVDLLSNRSAYDRVMDIGADEALHPLELAVLSRLEA